MIYRHLIDGYNADELDALTFEMTGTTDMIYTDADTLSERAIAITTWAARHNQLSKLIELMEGRDT